MMSNEALSTTIAHLRELLTWPDGWNGYDVLAPSPDAVSHAEQWITEFFHHLMWSQQQWIAPNITGGDGGVVFTWRYGQRKLTIYVDSDEQDIDYVQDWREHDLKARLTDGCITSIDDMQQLWQWLLETTSDHE